MNVNWPMWYNFSCFVLGGNYLHTGPALIDNLSVVQSIATHVPSKLTGCEISTHKKTWSAQSLQNYFLYKVIFAHNISYMSF